MENHEFKKNSVLHMARGTISVGKIHFAKKCQQKSSQQKKVNAVEESSEDDVYVLHEA